MKKTLKKLSKIVVISILLLAIDLSLVLNCVQAVDLEKKNVYEIDWCRNMLKYRGILRDASYVVYEENGKQHPAYCINPERIGVGDTPAYDVTVDGYITDVTLWRIITNGYPYKTLEELGVANSKEAYLATKQAIYSYIEGRNVNEYIGIGEAGARALNALKQIWNNAMNSEETKISNIVNICNITTEWTQDAINNKYISKSYKVEAPTTITNFTVEIQGENTPEGLIIADANNNAKTTFKPNEEFKILIPINILKNNGSFEIRVKTKMETKPVIYGVAPNTNLQNYALTTFSYEDSEGLYYEEYQKNESQIEILKQEKGTKTPLKGVEFQLLDSEQKVIMQSLATDEKGKISIKGIQPGIYYLKEIKTLPGYVLYDENIKINVQLNEKINVVVNNSKEKNIEISKETTNIEVSKDVTNAGISKENTNIEISENVTNAQMSKDNTNAEVSENITNIEVKTSEQNIKKVINEINIRKLPKTGM